MNFLVDKEGYYGEFGGAYVPEILHKCVEELQNTYLKVLQSEDFKREYDQLLRDYVGRPSPLYLAHRLSEKYGCHHQYVFTNIVFIDFFCFIGGKDSANRMYNKMNLFIFYAEVQPVFVFATNISTLF